jgi:hypothetical protein
MGKKLTPEEERAVRDVGMRLTLTIKYIESVEEFPSGKGILSVIDRATKKNDLRTLRLLTKEIDSMSLALSPARRRELEQLLHTELGVSLEEEKADLHGAVAKVLARGTIAGEKERRRLQEYVEMLEATGGDLDVATAVRRLLANHA